MHNSVITFFARFIPKRILNITNITETMFPPLEEIVSEKKSEPVSKVVQLMKTHGYSQLPVFDGKQPVGSISEKAILRQILDGKDMAEVSGLPASELREDGVR